MKHICPTESLRIPNEWKSWFLRSVITWFNIVYKSGMDVVHINQTLTKPRCSSKEIKGSYCKLYTI